MRASPSCWAACCRSSAGVTLRLEDAAWVGHRLAEILPMDLADKQFCLELEDPIRRLDVLGPLIEISSDQGTDAVD